MRHSFSIYTMVLLYLNVYKLASTHPYLQKSDPSSSALFYNPIDSFPNPGSYVRSLIYENHDQKPTNTKLNIGTHYRPQDNWNQLYESALTKYRRQMRNKWGNYGLDVIESLDLGLDEDFEDGYMTGRANTIVRNDDYGNKRYRIRDEEKNIQVNNLFY